MKSGILPLLVVVLASSAARGQEPAPGEKQPPIERATSFSQMTPTPGMWFYDQAQRQYNDPKQSVRRKAEFMADQRRRQIASMEWFGFSNSRPVVNPTPYTGTYSPMWVSNGACPSQWSGSAPQTLIVRPMIAPSGAVYGLW